MRIALDPFMQRHVPLLDLPAHVRDLGFDAIEVSPRIDFIPFFRHPRIGSSGIAAFRTALEQAGVEVVSVVPRFPWSSPDEAKRQAAVRYWKRAIAVTVELGCQRLNSEFGGRVETSEASEAQFWRSMDELLPVLETEDVSLALEPHPNDFVESSEAAVGLIKGIGSPLVTYLYSAPHAFHLGGDIVADIRRAGHLVTHVHLADALDHRASSGLRYIVNPPGSAVRVHQHLDIGRGEVDFEVLFAALKVVRFDGVLTSSVLGWDDRADESARFMRERIGRYVDRYLA